MPKTTKPDAPDDADFLSGNVDPNRFEPLLRTRKELVRWAAGALLSRHPNVASYRGKKGLLACEQDLDFHMRHLCTSLKLQDPASMTRYARWVVDVLARRGVSGSHVSLGVAVLAEAIERFVEWPDGAQAAAALAASFADTPQSPL